MMFTGVYELSVLVLGELPQEWTFLYYIFSCVFAIGFIYVIMSPIFIAYELLGVRK